MPTRLLYPLVIAAASLHGVFAEPLIRFDKQVLETDFYAEGASFGDLNKDGHQDIVYGPFWFAGPDFKQRHTIYEPKSFNINGYSDNFFSFVEDVTGDGYADVLVLGFPGKEARLYVNPGKDIASTTSWPAYLVASVVDNESPDFVDMDGDGRKEIVCSQQGQFGYYKAQGEDATKPWQWIAISENVGVQRFTHGLGVGDVNGDGKLDLLEARRWWQAPAEVNGKWQSHTFQLTGGGGAQMFAYDFNGDGRNDIITSLNAHQFGVAWFENQMGQTDKAAWNRHLIVGQEPWENEYGIRFSQPHALTLADMDGDGVQDLITGKRYWAHNGNDPNERDPKVLYWFQTRRGKDGSVEFIPHLIDSDTGVGTQVVAGDLNGDGLNDVLVGNKYGLRVLLQRREDVNTERYAQFQPKKIYGSESLKTAEYKKGQTADEAVKNMVLPAGFKADLVASEPDLVQPIAFCWDERGRIWVIEGNTYPKRAEEGQGRDRILIFEDADGDGKFETRKVFLEGLNLASGIEVGYGGVWVGAAPYFLFIPDKDRDDKPDGEPVKLLDGWGYQDTHETLNSFIWGPDGWLYGCHGVFTHSKVGKPGTPDKERIPLNAAIWRYHPVRHEFEVFAHGTSNPWGLDYNEKGEFFTTACVIPHLYHIIPGARYQRQAGQHFNEYTYDDIKTIAEHRHFAGDIRDNAHWGDRKGKFNLCVPADTDQAGGGHAHCGLAIYNGDNFPELYRGALLFGNLHGHRLVHNAVEPKGSGYTGQRRADFMRSNDFWFIPVTQRVGPDGALYVSDWTDKQVCHQTNPGVWDRENGRIFRVVYDTLKPWKGDLGKMSDQELTELALNSKNEWFSRMARRVLAERSAIQKEQASKTLAHLQKTTAKSESAALAMIWTKTQIEDMAGLAASSVIKPNAGFVHERAWRVRLGANQTSKTDWSSYAGFARDEKSLVVRREIASALQRMPLQYRKDIAKALFTHKDDAKDQNIPLLVWYGIEPLVGQDSSASLELAQACQWEQVTGFIYRRMAATEEGRSALLSAIVSMKDAAQRENALQWVTLNARSGAALQAPQDWSSIAAKLRENASPSMLAYVTELAAYFGDKQAAQPIREMLANQKADAKTRGAALDILLKARDKETAPLLQTIVADKAASPSLRRKALQAMSVLPHQKNAETITAAYGHLSAEEKVDALASLSSSAEGAVSLLQAVADKRIAAAALSPFLVRQLKALDHDRVNDLLSVVIGSSNAPKAGLEEQKAKWIKVLQPEKIHAASVTEGQVLFAAACGTCHTLNGQGAHVGPDLTGSNRGNLEYLLDNVLDPNALIGADYQLNIFTMKDGRLMSGVVRAETGESFTIVMQGGVELILSKKEIKKREISKSSMMPEGLFDALGEEQTLKLVAYLQAGAAGLGSGQNSVLGLLEGEKLRSSVTRGSVRPQPMAHFSKGPWSGDSQLWWTGGKVGDVLTVEIPVEKAGMYAVYGTLTRAKDYGIFEIRFNGEAIGEPLDLYDPEVVTTGELDWGRQELKKGVQKLEVRIIGSNTQAVPALMFGLDSIRLTRMGQAPQ